MEQMRLSAEQGQEVEDLLLHPGWQFLARYLETEKSSAINELKAAVNLLEIGRCQGKVSAYDSLALRISGMIQEGKQAKSALTGR